MLTFDHAHFHPEIDREYGGQLVLAYSEGLNPDYGVSVVCGDCGRGGNGWQIIAIPRVAVVARKMLNSIDNPGCLCLTCPSCTDALSVILGEHFEAIHRRPSDSRLAVPDLRHVVPSLG